MNDERVWAIYAATMIEANLVCLGLDVPVGTRVMMFCVSGPPKWGHQFDRIYVKPPVGDYPRYWDAKLAELRLGLRQNGEEITIRTGEGPSASSG